jgi:endonuclease YncB( thermonuclease family)
LVPVNARDADSVEFDGMAFRLDGIDAPELDQSCLDAKGATYPCGRLAVEALTNLIGQQPAHCEDRGADSAYEDRRIGLCYAADGTEINRWLVQQGWALNFEPYARGRFNADEDEARNALRAVEGMFRCATRLATLEQEDRQPVGFQLSSRCPRQAVS